MLRIVSSLAAAVVFSATLNPAAAAPQSPRAACTTPATDPAIAQLAAADVPTIAREQGASGTTVVELVLAANGKIVSRKIAKSSGNFWLDRAALESAGNSRYLAERQDCAGIGGRYLLTIDFGV